MTKDIVNDNGIDVSILVCAYNMARELPRTLFTLSRNFQRNISDICYEVVVLDNGSNPPLNEDALRQILPEVRVLRPQAVNVSPAIAINAALRELQGRLIGLWIDGARLASPGVVRLAVEAWKSDPSRAIGTLAFHLGPDVQMRSVFAGYDAKVEDALLDTVPWREDGYRLFDISVLAGSSINGWFGCINETNGLFMDRSLWQRLSGLDERFRSRGGGLVNLDLWERAVTASGDRPWMMLGEGTFHQVHGGAATNGTADAREEMHAEYLKILQRPFVKLNYNANYVGSLDVTRLNAGTPPQD